MSIEARDASSWSSVAIFFSISLVFAAVSIPFSLYSQFVIEERFGFNKMTFGLYLWDMLKSALISVLLFTPLILGLFWFMDRAGDLWWVYGFLGVAAFQLLIMVIYPTVIAPLFNKFKPLEDGSLKDDNQQKMFAGVVEALAVAARKFAA